MLYSEVRYKGGRFQDNMRRRTKSVTAVDLADTLKHVGTLVKKERNQGSYSIDFDLAIPFLEKEGFATHIVYFRPRMKYSSTTSLNSDNRVYQINNVIIKDLEITLSQTSLFGKEYAPWDPLSTFMWHFERCRFDARQMDYIRFPWSGDFRFHKCQFAFSSTGLRVWIFSFVTSSRVTFQQNDFQNSSVQMSKIPPDQRDMRSNSTVDRLSRVALVGNKGIDSLTIECRARHYVLRGSNRIDSLSFAEFSSLGLNEDCEPTGAFYVHFGALEMIDPKFYKPYHHRDLFISIRELAISRHDAWLVKTLDRQIDRIEYFLAKEQPVAFLSSRMKWFHYWQERLLYAWRRWASNFHQSWFRPLLMIVLGYAVFNGLATLWIDGFSVSDWITFMLRPINKVPFYTESLKEQIGTEYNALSAADKNWLRFIGILEVVWLAVWGFVLRKAIVR